MKEILESKYSRFFIAGFLLNILCAWFSTGFHHVDEHFQILEFCSYKLGNTSASFLTWEFTNKVREVLLPLIAYLFAKAMLFTGTYNPFTLIFILRLLTGVFTWFITCKLCILLSERIKTPVGQKLLIVVSMLLWWVPYISVRYTSESISCITFLYGIYYILKADRNGANSIKTYLLAGLLFGISFYVRIQIAVAIAGLLAWLIIIRKIQWKYIAALSIAGILVLCISPLLDYWFYGVVTFSPFNYFNICILKHEAAQAGGVSPWWFYFNVFIRKGFPPISLLLLVMSFTGIYKNGKDPIVWIFVPFILALLVIGHKEFRYLFPVTFIFGYVSVLGFDYFLTKEFYKKIHTYIYAAAILICIPLLLFRTLVPANVEANYYKFLYDYSAKKNTTVFCIHSEYYCTIFDLRASFYNSPTIKTISIDSIPQINNYLQANKPESVLFLDKQDAGYHWNIPGYTVEMMYCYLPEWIVKRDTKYWIVAQLSNEPGTRSWHIYRFTKT